MGEGGMFWLSFQLEAEQLSRRKPLLCLWYQ